jgi:hypothetical protein
MIDKMMNCTAVGRYYFDGWIYGDYMATIEQGLAIRSPIPTEKIFEIMG